VPVVLEKSVTQQLQAIGPACHSPVDETMPDASGGAHRITQGPVHGAATGHLWTITRAASVSREQLLYAPASTASRKIQFLYEGRMATTDSADRASEGDTGGE